MTVQTSLKPTLALLALGTAFVAGGVLLLHAGAQYAWDGSAPTCAGDVMSPGDQCLSWGRRGSYDYDQGIVDAVDSGRFLRGIGGILVGGLGATLLYAAGSFARRPAGRICAASGLLTLFLAALGLLTVGSGFALVAAVGAAAAGVVLSVAIGVPVGRVVYYAAGVGLLAGAAALVASGSAYAFGGRLSGAGPSDSLTLFLADAFRAHGAELRYVGAVVALAVACRLLRTALDGLPRESVGPDSATDLSDAELEARHHLILTPVTPTSLRAGLWCAAGAVAWAGAAYLATRATAAGSVGAVVLVLLGLAAAGRLAPRRRPVAHLSEIS
ncbi:hypothetical protein [Cryptosporangium phraense]|uniref:Uncharacterized protein n=1 Tax=Cryptosporangium phraense TaxID=2593070 RepID=A0A545AKT1_9ACTN|nr:hypothetical protein [Cryptosporangium phraense]TQS41891.1 hypothetical protein FL583_26780 [Cryptosporangium phraense]